MKEEENEEENINPNENSKLTNSINQNYKKSSRINNQS